MGLTTVDAFKHIDSPDTVVLTPEELEAYQRLLSEMLDEVTDLLDANGLSYTLGGGTALGAVRHHGFIPWDDDVDLNIPRADYDRFLVLAREKLSDRYYVHDPQNTHNYGLLFTRVVRKGTCVKTREDFANPECGAFIDIFPVENTYDNRILRGLHGFGCMAYGYLVSCRKFRRDRKPLMALARSTGDRKLTRVFRFKIFCGTLLAWDSLDGLSHRADRWNARCKDSRTAWVTVPTGRHLFFGELYRRKDFAETQTVPFGSGTKKIAKDAAGYLARLYGPDYMTPPPDAAKEKHVFFRPFDLGPYGPDERVK